MDSTTRAELDDQISNVAEAFTRQSAVYDEYEVDNENLSRLRNEIYQHVLRLIHPDDKILEINAGTGTDAVFFAQKGFRIHATDLSKGMLEKLEDKIKRHGLGEKLTMQQLSFTQLDRVEGPPYQYCFSNIGGLNCIPDLAEFTRHLPRVLSPGAITTIVVMSPICPWEWLEVFRGNVRGATRRWQKGGAVVSPKGVPYRLYYFTPGHVISSFGPRFRLVNLQSLSLFAPPMDRKQFSKRRPGLYKALVALDEMLTHRYPFNRIGDFLIFSFVYEPG